MTEKNIATMTSKGKADLPKALRNAIAKSGLSNVELGRQSGVPAPTICRFRNGTDIRLETASKLAGVVGGIKTDK